jgi:hypothetical protein
VINQKFHEAVKTLEKQREKEEEEAQPKQAVIP